MLLLLRPGNLKLMGHTCYKQGSKATWIRMASTFYGLRIEQHICTPA